MNVIHEMKSSISNGLRIAPFLCSLLVSLTSSAQKEANHWYFGFGAGLDFSSGTVVVDTNTNMNAGEGCSVISNSSGDLLFYTNGESVWDRNHQTMPNGMGILGNDNSTQAALIIPLPKSDSLYYIFTTESSGQPGGFRYSVVDMTLNGGLGDVITGSKNTLLITPVTEQVAATKTYKWL